MPKNCSCGKGSSSPLADRSKPSFVSSSSIAFRSHTAAPKILWPEALSSIYCMQRVCGRTREWFQSEHRSAHRPGPCCRHLRSTWRPVLTKL